MLYRAFCKTYPYKSHLGEMTFLGVPVTVKSKALAGKNVAFDQAIATPGDVIDWMERETAKQFVMNFRAVESKDLTDQQIYGIMVFLGVSQSELADLLAVDKATVTKVLKGKFKLKAPECVLLVSYLFIEILKPGIVKERGQDALFSAPGNKVIKPETNYEHAA